MKKKCSLCGNEFVKSASNSKRYWAQRLYCSSECGNKSRVGKYISWNKGTKGICIAWNKGLPGLKGSKNGAWKGTDDKYWRNKAKERDNDTCQECGLREPEIMEVDHIKPKSKFPELRYKLENLKTLCPNCHKRKTIKEIKLPRKTYPQFLHSFPILGKGTGTEDDIIKL